MSAKADKTLERRISVNKIGRPEQSRLKNFNLSHTIMITNQKQVINAAIAFPLSLGCVGTEDIVLLAKLLSAIGIREDFATQCPAYDALYEASAKCSLP